MPSSSIDVTVVLNAHREGILIHRTFRSLSRAIECAEESGIRCQVVAVLDRPDVPTAEYFAHIRLPFVRVLEVDLGDPGLARNRGVAEALGAYVAFLDGDDLISRNWLTAAFCYYEQNQERVLVLHPVANIFFGEETNIFPHVDQDSPEFRLSSLFAANQWTALAFAKKQDLLRLPFRSTPPDSGFGYEDWDWNCLTVEAGWVHKTVPGTWHFIRARGRGSRNRMAQEENILVRPSRLFDRLEMVSKARPEEERVGKVASMGSEPGYDKAGIERFLNDRDLVAEWLDLSRLEPELFPSREKLHRFRLISASVAWIGELFGRLLRQWGEAPTHVILCDHWCTGTAGHLAMAHAHAIAEMGGVVVFVLTGDDDSKPDPGFPEGIRVVRFGQLCAGLDLYWQIRLLARTLLQRPAKVVHCIESRAGYETLACYGLPIARSSRIFASFLRLRLSPEGEPTGFVISYFPKIAPYLSGLMSDTTAVLEWISDTYGYPREHRHVLPAPLFSSPARMSLDGLDRCARPRAFWAGGEESTGSVLLFRIARLLPDWDFLLYHPKAGMELERRASSPDLPNLVAMDREADVASADILLYTGLTLELPRLLIEAVTAGLPVVAAAHGAILEVIDENTGYPVWDFHRPESYVARLDEISRAPDEARRRARNARLRFRKRNSWGRFVRTLQNVKGYL